MQSEIYEYFSGKFGAIKAMQTLILIAHIQKTAQI